MKSPIVISGKRKRSVARAVITEGKGNVKINKENYRNLQLFKRLMIEEPIRIADRVLGGTNFDVNITVRGGGEKGQIEASRLALAKAIVKFSNSKELRKEFLEYDRHLLIADTRRKEAYKPDDSKARSKRQSSKR